MLAAILALAIHFDKSPTSMYWKSDELAGTFIILSIVLETRADIKTLST